MARDQKDEALKAVNRNVHGSNPCSGAIFEFRLDNDRAIDDELVVINCSQFPFDGLPGWSKAGVPRPGGAHSADISERRMAAAVKVVELVGLEAESAVGRQLESDAARPGASKQKESRTQVRPPYGRGVRAERYRGHGSGGFVWAGRRPDTVREWRTR